MILEVLPDLNLRFIPNVFEMTNQQIFDLSIQIIIVAIIIVVLGLIIFLIANKKSREERLAKKLLKQVALRRKGKIIPKKVEEKKEEIKGKEEIKKGEVSLKQMLVKKFQPVIERQLQTKLVVDDLNAKGDNFIAKVSVQGHKLELVLDSSGKIVDYKNLD